MFLQKREHTHADADPQHINIGVQAPAKGIFMHDDEYHPHDACRRLGRRYGGCENAPVFVRPRLGIDARQGHKFDHLPYHHDEVSWKVRRPAGTTKSKLKHGLEEECKLNTSSGRHSKDTAGAQT